MNKTVTIALASLLAVSPVAGVAYAQQSMDADTMATGSISADKVNVVQISTLEADQDQRAEFDRLSHKVNDPAALEKAQAELKARLEKAEEEDVAEVDTENTDVELVSMDDDGDATVADDDLPDMGDDDVELDDDDDTFLEADEDDDDDDMSGIIGVTGGDDDV